MGAVKFTYDRIGGGYVARRPDARLSARLVELLSSSSSVVNIGAGTGSYEPDDRCVIAVEPSSVMIAQRLPECAPCVQASAEDLPFPSDSFEAALAVSTVHHWSDLARGLREMRRVADKRIVYFSEPARYGEHWIVDDYFPEIVTMATNLSAPRGDQVAELLGGDVTVEVFETLNDFTDGAGAYWARPEQYCDPSVQNTLSMFALLDDQVVRRGTARLRDDLKSGRWDERYKHLRSRAAMDVGYRIAFSRG